MAEKPILFSTPMVQAILDGRKSMTRRVVKITGNFSPESYRVVGSASTDDNPLGLMYVGGIHRPRYQPSDVLWVRETWAHGEYADLGKYVYKADYQNPNATPGLGKWHPSIHMPRAAARIFLRVTGVRAERLREITNDDAIAEGIYIGEPNKERYAKSEAYRLLADNLAIAQFADLWDSLNAKRGYGWDTNPWVWVYTFERIKKG